MGDYILVPLFTPHQVGIHLVRVAHTLAVLDTTPTHVIGDLHTRFTHGITASPTHNIRFVAVRAFVSASKTRGVRLVHRFVDFVER
jgi:hypothetical protein